ncbi:MAG: TIGR04076 family protein [bacterium]
MEKNGKPWHRVVGRIKETRGTCQVGHKAGDTLELDAHDPAGICGFLFHSAFPYLVMLQFGGGFPPEWGGPDVVELDCPDRANAVTLELRRMRE